MIFVWGIAAKTSEAKKKTKKYACRKNQTNSFTIVRLLQKIVSQTFQSVYKMNSGKRHFISSCFLTCIRCRFQLVSVVSWKVYMNAISVIMLIAVGSVTIAPIGVYKYF